MTDLPIKYFICVENQNLLQWEGFKLLFSIPSQCYTFIKYLEENALSNKRTF